MEKSGPMPQLIIDDNHRYQLSSFLMFTIVGAIMALGATVFFFLYNISLGNQVTDLEEQKSALVSEIGLPENVETEKVINGAADSIAKITSIKSENRYGLNTFLADFNKIVPKDVKINNMSVDEQRVLKIDGTTTSQFSVARFVVSLNQAKYLSDVQLMGSNKGSENDKAVVSFSISTIVTEQLP